MCAGNGHLLRVGPFIIARRYTYKAARVPLQAAGEQSAAAKT
jgi:hypothetical protein